MQFGWNPPLVIKPEQADRHVHYTEPYATGHPGLGEIPLSYFEKRQEEKKRILEVIYKNDRWYCPMPSCEKSFTLKFTLQRHLLGGSHQKDDPRVIEWLKKIKSLVPHRQMGVNTTVSDPGLSAISLIHFMNQQEEEKRKREILEVIYKNERWYCPLCQKSFSLKATLQRHLQCKDHDQNDPKVSEWLDKLSGRLGKS